LQLHYITAVGSCQAGSKVKLYARESEALIPAATTCIKWASHTSVPIQLSPDRQQFCCSSLRPVLHKGYQSIWTNYTSKQCSDLQLSFLQTMMIN